MPSATLVRCETSGPIATISLDSQHNRNALSRELVAQLRTALDTADRDDAIRVVVLRADGPTFCAGADLGEAVQHGMAQGAGDLLDAQRQIVALSKPVVVAVHAAVRAGGLGLVAAADVAIAADTVTFAFTEARLALAPAVISVTTRARMTNRAAARTFLTAETFDAAAAADFGLISQAVAPDELNNAVARVTDAICQGKNQGLRETKRLLNKQLLQELDDRRDELVAASAALFGSDEARAAMSAFLDRKKR